MSLISEKGGIFMKRLSAMLLSMALLLSLGGCGSPADAGSSEATASTAAPAPASAVENADGYVIPAVWTETSLNDGTWGYVTQAAELPADGNYEVEDGYLVGRSNAMDTKVTTLIRCTLTGEELCRVEIPPMNTAENVDDAVTFYCFGENCLWLIHDSYCFDPETDELTDSCTQLEQWSFDGQQLAVVPIDEAFGLKDKNSFVCDLALDSEGKPMLITDQQQLFFCDSQGHAAATAELADIGFGFCRDASGRLYLRDTFNNQVYSIDWDSHALGQVVLSTDSLEKIMPGGGDYDFLLSSDTRLRGVSLASGTITELLSWADWDLAGSVGSVTYMDEDTYLISVFSLLLDGSQILTLNRVPASEIPEKTVVRLAVGLDPEGVSWGMTWADALDQSVTEAMNQFNRGSADYRVEVVTFSDAEELNQMLLTGDAPDLIDWHSTDYMAAPPSMELYAKKGYLTDMTSLLEADPDYSAEDIIPSILELAENRTGGLHAMPLSFYFVTMSASKEYVGDSMGWTLSDLLAAAEKMPEGMTLLEYSSQRDMLDLLLRTNLDAFVDISAGTCDFENQSFYDLLTLCRDYCPAEVGEDYIPPEEGTLLRGEGSMGRLGQFASDVMRPLEEQGRTLIGYPGAGGSGISIVFYDEISICALGQQQEGAWQFLRTLLSYDYQYGASGPMCSIRQDAFDAREDWYLEVNGSCTREESLAARELVYGAENLRTNSSPAAAIVLEEADAFFAGDKTAQETAEIIQNRVEIYLGEQS